MGERQRGSISSRLFDLLEGPVRNLASLLVCLIVLHRNDHALDVRLPEEVLDLWTNAACDISDQSQDILDLLLRGFHCWLNELLEESKDVSGEADQACFGWSLGHTMDDGRVTFDQCFSQLN